jgi:UDPglucose--hexose-1-phosphate uridylyltransferase
MPVEHIERLVEVWTDRYATLAKRSDVDYVLIFENRGVEIGVTLTHPHGQIYAFPFIPSVPARELAVANLYSSQHGACLHCDVVQAEVGQGTRVVFKNKRFVVYVPYAARYPFELHVVSRTHCGSLEELDAPGRSDLAAALKVTLQKYDSLWSRPMPFVMVVHQRPVDGAPYEASHLHIEFTPPYRSREKLKYQAGCEVGAGVFINDASAEDTAAALRAVEQV